MSPRDASGSSGKGTAGGAFTPGRIAVAVIAILTLVFISRTPVTSGSVC
ncbi:hypothetical protein [Streptomyces sp. A5-4]